MVELSDMPREEIIQIKYGLTAGTRPSSLLRGELAVNLADLVAFVGNDLGAAVPLLGKDYLLSSASYYTDTSGITVPPLAEFVEIIGCGGGGGGGAGTRTAGIAFGGPGGQGGVGGRVFFPLDELGITAGSVLKITIGTGGVGGLGNTATGNQAGRAGSNGSSTFLQSNDGSITYMEFPGGKGGFATSTTSIGAEIGDYWSTPRFGKLIQGDGGLIHAANLTPPPYANGTPSQYGGGGGGAGGWVSTSTPGSSNGGTGGGFRGWVMNINGGWGGTGGPAQGDNNNSTNAPANGITGWGGGGGGGRSPGTVVGRNGGDGAEGGPGGGGGGGGGGLRNTTLSTIRPGNGGTGGNGYITLRWWGLVGQTVYGRIPLR